MCKRHVHSALTGMNDLIRQQTQARTSTYNAQCTPNNRRSTTHNSMRLERSHLLSVNEVQRMKLIRQPLQIIYKDVRTTTNNLHMTLHETHMKHIPNTKSPQSARASH